MNWDAQIQGEIRHANIFEDIRIKVNLSPGEEATCFHHFSDFCSSAAGGALLRQINEMAGIFPARRVTIQFANEGVTGARCEADGNLYVNLNLREIDSDRYPYLVRHGDGSLGFVSVYHPPSVVLGHELGHVRQFLEEDVRTDAPPTLNERLVAQYCARMTPVATCFLEKARAIDPTFTREIPAGGVVRMGMPNTDEGLNTLYGCYVAVRAHSDTLGAGDLKTLLEALQEAFWSLLIAPWDAGKFADLLSIIPIHRDGANNPTISDGIFLRQIMTATNDIRVGDSRKPAVFAFADPVLGALTLPDAQATAALAGADRTLLRWSHMGTQSLRGGLQGEVLRMHPHAGEYRDMLISALFTQVGVDGFFGGLPQLP